MQIGDCSHYDIDPSMASITVLVSMDLCRRLMKYASDDRRTPGLLIIEAVEQMMNRYRKGKVDTLEKRIDQIKRDLEQVLEESKKPTEDDGK